MVDVTGIAVGDAHGLNFLWCWKSEERGWSQATAFGRHGSIPLSIDKQHFSVVLEVNHGGRVVHVLAVHPHRHERCGRSSATFLGGTEG